MGVGVALAVAGVTILLRMLFETERLTGTQRPEIILNLVSLGLLLAAALGLAAIAWWMVVRLHKSRQQLRESARQLQHLSFRDPLTGLYNRRYFFEAYLSELARAQRTGLPFSVAMLDLNRFKRLNDSTGHAAGDALLVSFADALRASVRSVDIVARYGGDEFVILMPSTNTEHAHAGIARLEHDLARWQPGTVPEAPRASIGVSTWEGTSDVLEQADFKMYEAKKLAEIPG